MDRTLGQERVSPQARRRDERLPGYLSFVAPLSKNPDETFDIVQMLELLECTHGANLVLAPLPILQLALLGVVTGTGRSLTELAAQRLYATAALFVGALVEDEIAQSGAPSKQSLTQRRAPSSAVVPRRGSPNLEFEDFLIAARMLVMISPAHPSAPAPAPAIEQRRMVIQVRRVVGLAAASWALRQTLKSDAASTPTERLLLELSSQAGNTWVTLACAVRDLLMGRNITLPGAFRALFVPAQASNNHPPGA
ncbi:MAG: hypothetical protein HC853_00010 [Anaerolineae bacterium]|nr:hypothetical protein [Anaerolineae bacterium]